MKRRKSALWMRAGATRAAVALTSLVAGAVLVTVLANGTLWAQSAVRRPGVAARASDAPAAPTGPDDPYVYPRGDRITSRVTPSGTVYTLSGNAALLYKDTTLKTDIATWNEETQVARSPGRVQIDDAQNTLIGDKGIAYYKKRTAEITGNVQITARPRPQNPNAPTGSVRREFKDPVTITCDRVVYNWRTRVAVPAGSLTARFTLRNRSWTVTGDQAVYDGRAEKVTLTKNVRGVSTSGEEINADEATVTLREDAETVLEIKGLKTPTRFKVEEEGETNEPPVPAPPQPNSPTNAPNPATPPAGAPTTPPAAPAPTTLPGAHR